MEELDLIDSKIVAELMRDATLSLAEIALRVGLSQTPCWRRIRRLEASGVLNCRVALADPAALGLRLSAFVGVSAPEQSEAWHGQFRAVVAGIPEIMEVWRMAGTQDYLLRVVVADMEAFDRLQHRLTEAVPIRALATQFALERIKFTTAYPLDTRNR